MTHRIIVFTVLLCCATVHSELAQRIGLIGGTRGFGAKYAGNISRFGWQLGATANYLGQKWRNNDTSSHLFQMSIYQALGGYIIEQDDGDRVFISASISEFLDYQNSESDSIYPESALNYYYAIGPHFELERSIGKHAISIECIPAGMFGNGSLVSILRLQVTFYFKRIFDGSADS